MPSLTGDFRATIFGLKENIHRENLLPRKNPGKPISIKAQIEIREEAYLEGFRGGI